MPFVNLNGTSIYYESKGAGHPLVLVHGFGLDTRMWDDQFDIFAEHFQVIRYDLRGHGRSSPPDFEIYSHTYDLCALLDYLKIEHVFIAGLSRGGRWAIQFALDYKEKTDALIIADAMPTGFAMKDEMPSLSGDIISSAQAGRMQDARMSWLNHPIFARANSQPVVKYRLEQMVSDYSGWHWLNDDPVSTGLQPAVQRLGEITIPTLLIIGEYDLDIYHRAADFICQSIPTCRKVVIPGVGHMSNMEATLSFNDAVLTFLNQLSTST